VLEALYGDHRVSPGDRGIVGVVSANRRPQGEALISTIGSMLKVLDVAHHETADAIDLDDRPITFRVHSASVRGVIGGSWIFACLDEVAHWRTDNEANPADEIIAAVRPCIAPAARGLLLLISAPAGTEDAHARLFDKGDTETQLVAWAPTWIARPTLTEAELRAFEDEPRYFSRDYGAVPQVGLSDALDILALRECVRPLLATSVLGSPVCFIDQSGGRVDGMPWAMAQWVLDGTRRVLRVFGLRAFAGAIAERMSQDEVAHHITADARQAGASAVIGDQHAEWAWRGSFQRCGGMPFIAKAWTNEAKSEAITRARQLIRERTLVIEPGPWADTLLREAARFRERVLETSGLTTFSAAGKSHDDWVMLLLLVLRYDMDGSLFGSTLFAPGASDAYAVPFIGHMRALEGVHTRGGMIEDGPRRAWAQRDLEEPAPLDPLATLRALQRAHRDTGEPVQPVSRDGMLARAQRDAASWDAPFITSTPTRGH
jgi:hypothetical protein